MLEVLQFIFSSFWVWLGFIVILVILGAIIYVTADVILRGRKDSDNCCCDNRPNREKPLTDDVEVKA